MRFLFFFEDGFLLCCGESARVIFVSGIIVGGGVIASFIRKETLCFLHSKILKSIWYKQ